MHRRPNAWTKHSLCAQQSKHKSVIILSLHDAWTVSIIITLKL